MHLRPVPVYNGSSNPASPFFSVLDYPALTQGLLQALYAPFATGTTTAQGLVQLDGGNATLVFLGSDEAMIDVLDTCDGSYEAQLLDVVVPIVCGDSAGRGLKSAAGEDGFVWGSLNETL